MLKILLTITITALLFQAEKPEETQENDAALVIFYQSTSDSSFLQNQLPWLKEVAANQQLDLILFNQEAGFPAKVTATPAIMYLGKNGKALFGGKYRERSAVENFARISRLRPVESQPDLRTDILSRQQGQQQVVIPLKITEQQGAYATTLPWGRRVELAFEAQGTFRKKDTVSLWPCDRRYYLDVHPYVEADGRVFLSAAVFSQFDCINAIWENFGQPFTGNVDELDALLEQLCSVSDSIINNYLNGSQGNESLSPLPDDAPGIALSELPELEKYQSEDKEKTYPILSGLEYAKPQALAPSLPMLSFNFPAPLDRYAGEVRKLKANITFNQDRTSISGNVLAEVKSMTMGMKDLDKKVLKSYLYAKNFPEARFDFANVPLAKTWRGGSALRIRVPGTFEMIGKSQPLLADAIFEPVQLPNGDVALAVTASFQLDISEPFGLTGPDGPEDLRNQMQFQFYSILSSK
jgi:hypothetical protein